MSRLSVSLALLGSLAGCVFDTSGTPRDGGGDDVGDPIDGPAGCPCALGCESDETTCLAFDPSNLDDLSLLDQASDALTLTPGTWTLDTDAATLRDPGNALVAGLSFTLVDKIRVLAVDALDIQPGATLQVDGPFSLIVLAARTITVDGTIDVSAGCTVAPGTPDRDRLWCGGPGGGDGGHRDGDHGRTDATGCAPGGAGDAGSTRSENGAGGGGYGTAGGDGGGADGNGNDSEGGGECGVPGLEPLEGGSGGGVAGYFNSDPDDNRTAGGGGGGGLQLTARLAIAIHGVIDASGEGGAGTAQAGSTAAGGDGGGGGGAGGGVLLEAPTVSLQATAIVAANGGGGGAGVTGGDLRGQRGQRSHVRAAGGLNDDASGGGFGSIGALAGEEATAGSSAGDGGSGGGGGAGRIRIHAVSISVATSAVVTPPATDASLQPL